jgi:hypothetical protein
MSKTFASVLFLVLSLQHVGAYPQESHPDKERPNRLIAIEIQGKWGYADDQGNVIIQPRFEKARNFYEGLAAVQIQTGKMVKVGSIDKQGTYITKEVAESKWGFIDENGTVAIKPQFEAIGDFSEGLAPASYQAPFPFDDSWGYIDRHGDMTIKPQFSKAQRFSEGLALVECCSIQIGDVFEQVATKMGYIDKTGFWMIHSRVAYFFYDDFAEGLVPFRKNLGKWGYMDATGRIVIKPKFSWAGKFSGGLAPVLLTDGCAQIDKAGEIVGQPQPERPADAKEERLRKLTRDRSGTVVRMLDPSPPCPYIRK